MDNYKPYKCMCVCYLCNVAIARLPGKLVLQLANKLAGYVCNSGMLIAIARCHLATNT